MGVYMVFVHAKNAWDIMDLYGSLWMLRKLFAMQIIHLYLLLIKIVQIEF